MPRTINGQTYYTPPEVAEQLDRHRSTVTRWCREGLLDAIDLGEGMNTRWLIPANSLETFDPPKLGPPFKE